jgi:hypothetical protein
MSLNEDPVWMEIGRTAEGFVTHLRFSWPRNVNTTSLGTVKTYTDEHLAARWERVVRRWENKRIA